MPAKRQPVMAGKADRERHQPPGDIGGQRVPGGQASAPDEGDDHAPVHGSRHAADRDEQGDTTARGMTGHGADQHTGPRNLCICVDDFALHAGIDDAAIQLAAMGRVHAIGCLVGAKAWTTRPLADLHGLAGIDIGLHLDLTETPLRAGSRRTLRTVIAMSLLHVLDAGQVRAEIRAQLDAFEDALGRPPDFIDGHQHVHQLPVVRAQLLDELATRVGPARPGWRPWLRNTRAARGQGGPGGLKPLIIQMLGARALATLARRRGFAQNHALLGVYDFRGGEPRYRSLLARWLSCAASGDLLMCHPATGDDAGDPLIAARRAEFEVLRSADFMAWADDAGVTLGAMSRILAHQNGVA